MASDLSQVDWPTLMSLRDTDNAVWAITHIPLCRRLPVELKESILSFVMLMSQPTIGGLAATRADVDEPQGPRGDPSIPPSNGKSPLLALPAELRRAIFASFLPNKQRTIKPRCEREGAFARRNLGSPRKNRTSDFMVLCRQIKQEITTVIYQERTFEIHVHEGVTGGGIEVLDAGRQLLQYLSEDYGIDTRFTRFGDGEEFGFDRFKKINIVIFPKTNNREERHTAMNTYFMNLALAHMLERGCVKDTDPIISLNIIFDKTPCARSVPQAQPVSGRLNIMRNEIHWWDPSLDQPLSSEVHGMSDIELILRPFSILRKVHNVNINLPPKINADAKTLEFVKDLKATMRSDSETAPFRQDVSFEMQANAIKFDLLNSNFGDMFGRNGDHIGDLTEQEMGDAGDGEADGSAKHVLSSPTDDSDPKRSKTDYHSLHEAMYGDLFAATYDEDDSDDDDGPPPPQSNANGKQRDVGEVPSDNGDNKSAMAQHGSLSIFHGASGRFPSFTCFNEPGTDSSPPSTTTDGERTFMSYTPRLFGSTNTNDEAPIP